MKISELFARNPERIKDYIVKVSDQDPEKVGFEMDEYVVTQEIRQYFSDIINLIIESRSSQPSNTCAWISGYFGSGKSHFLKMLGYVLANSEIILPNHKSIHATEFFCNKHSLNFAPILSKEFRIRSIFVHMLDYGRDDPQGPSISKIIYKALMREFGHSEEYWIAEIEQLFQKEGKWEEFRSFVFKRKGKSWEEIRKNTTHARSNIIPALVQILPDDYPNETMAHKCLDDLKSDQLTPSKLVDKIKSAADQLDKNKGRIVILLDEVGYYIGRNNDRLTDLNAVSEYINQMGKGRIFLFVTAQEELEAVIPKIVANTTDFQFLRDRFKPLKLTPKNIDTVVKQRLLEKVSEKETISQLQLLYQQNSGALSLAASIQNPAREKDLFTKIDEKQFIASYPLLPYHILIIQETLGQLRSGGYEAQEMTGRERGVLSIVKSLLVHDFVDGKIVDSKIGRIVTFSMVYDAINDLLKAVKSDQQNVIENNISKIGTIDKLSVSDVAKALFILQQVGDWIPCTVENISAILYPELGFDSTFHKLRVKKCLDELYREKWIAEEGGKYRFLTETERTFEDTVAHIRIIPQDKKDLITEFITPVLGEFKKINYEGKPFDVKVTFDNENISTNGHIELKLYSPLYSSSGKVNEDSLIGESIGRKNAIYWISDVDSSFDELLENTSALKKALIKYDEKPNVQDDPAKLKRPRKQLLDYEDSIPQIFRKDLMKGKIIHKGIVTSLDGRKEIAEIFISFMKPLIEEIFTEYHYAAVKITNEADLIRSILSWTGGPLPGIFTELELINSNGEILTERPVAARILRKIHDKNSENSGQDFQDFFDAPPYGWDARVTRIVLATLFKNSSILIELNGKEFSSPQEQGAIEAILDSRKFRTAYFYQGVVITPAQRDAVKKRIRDLFGERPGDTIEDIDLKLLQIIEKLQNDGAPLLTTSLNLDLPCHEELKELMTCLKKIHDSPSRDRRLVMFLEDDCESIISHNLPILKKMIQFQQDGNIQKYKEINDFLVKNGDALIVVSPDVEASISTLHSDLSSDDYIARWPNIREQYRQLKDQYISNYVALHEELNREINLVVNNLSNYDKAVKNPELLTPVTSMKCISIDKESLMASTNICPHCNRSLLIIHTSIQSLDSKREAIEKELRKDTKKPFKGKIKPVHIEKTSMDPRDLEKIIDEIQELRDKAVSELKQLNVHIDIEVL